MSPSTSVIYEFGEFRLDVRERLLTKAGQTLSVPPKVFDTLAALVEEEGRLVRRADLMVRLWPDSFVEDATLARNISDLRKVLGEADSEQKLIETVPRIGYRFAAPVKKLVLPGDITKPREGPSPQPRRHWPRAVWAAVGAAAAIAALAGIVSWRLIRTTNVTSVAVLPLLSLEESRENAILGQELADSLITKLSLSALIVRPTSSILSYTSRDRDPLAAGRQLRVDAVLDGVVGRYENLYRVTLRLLRVRDGRSIWAGTFNVPRDDVFSLQDKASEQIAAALFPGSSEHLVKASLVVETKPPGSHIMTAGTGSRNEMSRDSAAPLIPIDRRPMPIQATRVRTPAWRKPICYSVGTAFPRPKRTSR